MVILSLVVKLIFLYVIERNMCGFREILSEKSMFVVFRV